MKIENLSRRGFLKTSSTLVVGATLPLALEVSPVRAAGSDALAPNVYVGIDPTGTVTVTAHRSEMGQGIRTALTQIVADELEADWSRVQTAQATGDKKYGDQNTDGSQSIRLFYDVLRQAGATTREMLRQAAAEEWSVPLSECLAVNHQIVHAPSNKRLDYGALVPRAMKLPVPDEVAFKTRTEQRYIGKPVTHVDITDIVSGSAEFGADVRLPEMVYAVVRRSPVLGAAVIRVGKPAQQPGFLGLEVIEPPQGAPVFAPLGGVAVIAQDTFTAKRIADELQVTWSDSAHQNFNSDVFVEELRTKVAEPGERLFDQGNIDAAFDGDGEIVEAVYESPFLAHAPMEPPVALARVTKDQCEVWAPVQDPQSTRGLVARWLGFELDQVTINVTLLGGAFGRKSKPDFVLEAVELAKRLRRPVRVQWLREDDIRHDFYHAASVQYHKALLDADGHPSAWLQRTAFPSITTTFSDQAVNPAPWELEMGFSNLPYRTPHQRFEYQGVRPGVRVGWMRSVCNVFHAFAANSFVDELAHAAGQDPIDYRLALLPSDAEAFAVPGMQAPQGHALDRSRLVNVTRRVRSLARWDEPRGPNRGLGFAVHHSFRSYVAMVVDVESTSAGHKVHDAFVVLDCGTFINPDTCRAQMEGAVVFGLSLALMGKMTVADGAVEQSNFHDYPMLRMPDCPDIHVELIESDALPAGVGEPGVPPVAPALTNAIYAASGKRIRTLPIRA